MTWENDHHEPARCERCGSTRFVRHIKAVGQYLCEDCETHEQLCAQEEHGESDD